MGSGWSWLKSLTIRSGSLYSRSSSFPDGFVLSVGSDSEFGALTPSSREPMVSCSRSPGALVVVTDGLFSRGMRSKLATGFHALCVLAASAVTSCSGTFAWARQAASGLLASAGRGGFGGTVDTVGGLRWSGWCLRGLVSRSWPVSVLAVAGEHGSMAVGQAAGLAVSVGLLDRWIDRACGPPLVTVVRSGSIVLVRSLPLVVVSVGGSLVGFWSFIL